MEEKIILNSTMDDYVKIKNDIIQNPCNKLKYAFSNINFQQEFIVNSDNELRYYYADYRLFFSVNGIPFLKTVFSQSFSFNKKKKKITTFNFSFKHKNDLIYRINEILDIKWFNEIFQCDSYCNLDKTIFFKNKILERIWSKKISSFEELINFYGKSIIGVKNIDSFFLKEFLSKSKESVYFKDFFYIKAIDEYVLDPSFFIKKIIQIFNEKDFDYMCHIFDFIRKNALLQQKMNLNIWNKKRFYAEYNKFYNCIGEAEIKYRGDILLFDKTTIKIPTMTNALIDIVSSEQECITISQALQSCLYRLKWDSLRDMHNLCFVINHKIYGRCAIIINQSKWNSDMLALFGIFSLNDTNIDVEFSRLIDKWLYENKKLLIEIFQDLKNKREKNKTIETFNNELDEMLF